MKIAIMSDLHVDHYSGGPSALIDHFCKVLPGEYGSIDVCVLAGDIADGRFPDQYACLFRGLKRWAHWIVIVTGNHDYYKTTLAQAHHSIERAIEMLDAEWGGPGHSGVRFLNKSSLYLPMHNRTIHGGTMWYRNRKSNKDYEHWMNDIHYIQDFKKWVYEENELFEHYVEGKVAQGDIVVTHHLPSMRSVPPQYKRSETNRFFVCDMEAFIKKREPALWIHGHTHSPADYHIVGDNLKHTRVVCNPRGYPRELMHGATGYVPKIIEV